MQLDQTYPSISLDLQALAHDPYPQLAKLQAQAPIAYVPELDAVLLTKHADIDVCEKNIAVFSSHQPGGLMTELMGANMMRKDGAAHRRERLAAMPALSMKTARAVWQQGFELDCQRLLDSFEGRESLDLVLDFATVLSGLALIQVTGLVGAKPQDMDRWSQAMIDGISNFSGLPEPQARCRAALAELDQLIDARRQVYATEPDASLTSVLMRSDLSPQAQTANIRLAISGGQNEARDVIAGAIWALLSHPEQQALGVSGQVSWAQVFAEYVRWMAPIGMSPRRIAQDHAYSGGTFQTGSKAMLMFGIANRDPEVFKNPNSFDLSRDCSRHMAFGAGPHFCAGAWVSKTLIAEVALPLFFQRFPKARLASKVNMQGWAFRGPKPFQVYL